MRKLRLLFVVGMLSFGLSLRAQVAKTELPTVLASKKFRFHANTAIPMADATLNQVLSQLGNTGGNIISLNGFIYDLQIYPDSVIAHLPYYGRTFTPVYGRNISNVDDLTETGIHFTTKKFDYQAEARKKGAWRIHLKTLDVRENYRLILDITESGYATLSVRDLYRQGISFYGFIDTIPEKKDD